MSALGALCSATGERLPGHAQGGTYQPAVEAPGDVYAAVVDAWSTGSCACERIAA